MKRRRATPKEFGLRVRTHPDTLLITARNKMASGIDVDGIWDVSLAGRMIESSRLYRDRNRNQENVSHVDRWLGSLRVAHGDPVESPFKGALLWRQVPATSVADFLEEFLVHPLNFDFQTDSIAAFLRGDDASNAPWTVAVLSKGEATLPNGEPVYVDLESLPKGTLRAQRRKVLINTQLGSLLVSGKSARVGSKTDIRHGFTREELHAASAAIGGATEDALRAQMPRPLLILYMLCGTEFVGTAPTAISRPYLDGQILPALGIYFPGEETPEPTRIRYRINRIAQKELFPIDDDADDDEATDDDTDD